MIQQGFCCVFDYIDKVLVDINKNKFFIKNLFLFDI